MTPRDEAIAAHIAATMARAWVWGETDCTSWLAGWVEARVGRPVGADLRQRGRSARSVARLIANAGGIVALASGLMRDAGCRRVGKAVNGDVGVVQFRDGRRPRRVCALRCNDMWVIRLKDGIAAMPGNAIAIWRVP